MLAFRLACGNPEIFPTMADFFIIQKVPHMGDHFLPTANPSIRPEPTCPFCGKIINCRNKSLIFCHFRLLYNIMANRTTKRTENPGFFRNNQPLIIVNLLSSFGSEIPGICGYKNSVSIIRRSITSGSEMESRISKLI